MPKMLTKNFKIVLKIEISEMPMKSPKRPPTSATKFCN